MDEIVTLNKNKDFKKIYSYGKYLVSSILVTYVLKNKSNNIRVGITTSKKIGNAVERNRARRVIKESWNSNFDLLKGNFDVVFIARKKTCYVKKDEVEKVMLNHLKKLGVLE